MADDDIAQALERTARRPGVRASSSWVWVGRCLPVSIAGKSRIVMRWSETFWGWLLLFVPRLA